MTRQFEILIQDGQRILRYPPMDGVKTEACMARLTSRGFIPVAETTANDITERLSLDELRWMLDGRNRL